MAKEGNVTFVDLDEIHQDEVVVNLDGKRHKMVPLSVLDFVKNMKALKQLAEEADLEKEVELVHAMLARSFPTIGLERIQTFSMQMVQSLQAAIQTAMNAA